MREVRFMAKKLWKPTVLILKGRKGKEVYEMILNTPRPDHSELRAESEKCKRIALETRNNSETANNFRK